MTENDVRILLQKAISGAGSQLAFAVDNDLDRTCLSDILAAKIAPTPQVLRALKLRRYYVYEKEGDAAR
jgi:hypothetical protein